MVREIDGIPLIEVKLPGRLRALFTTRLGGESTGRYASLNLSLRTGDDSAVVERNRARLARMVDRQLISPAQAHGLRACGAAEYLQQDPDHPCDGLSVHPDIDTGLAALLLFADCVPVVLCSEVDMAVAHGGWRGILGGIIAQTGRACMGPPGAAVIGPSIGPCCFTVEEEVAAAFADRFGSGVVSNPEGGRYGDGRFHVDLWAAATIALGELGVPEGQVVNPRLCTSCNNDLFFSHRKDGDLTGRQGCLAWVATA